MSASSKVGMANVRHHLTKTVGRRSNGKGVGGGDGGVGGRWEMRCGDGGSRRSEWMQDSGHSLSSGKYHRDFPLVVNQLLVRTADCEVVDTYIIVRFITCHGAPQHVSRLTDELWHGRTKPRPQPSSTRRSYAEDCEEKGDYDAYGGYGNGDHDLGTDYVMVTGLHCGLIVLVAHWCALYCIQAVANMVHGVLSRCGPRRMSPSLGSRGNAESRMRIQPGRRCGASRRTASRKAVGDPWIRPRARCRRIEACFAIYLLASGGICHAAAGRRVHCGGARHADGNGHPMTVYGHGERIMQPCEGLRVDGIAFRDLCADKGHAQVGDTARRGRGRWWTDASRVGEASEPGPSPATIAVDGMLRKVYSTAKSALCYPAPGANALSRIIAPGFPAAASEQKGNEDFAMCIETVNATGWRALQRRLLATRAHAVLAQETWLSQDAVPAASAWARRHGWQSIWTAATPGPNGGASGGAAIFLRVGLGLRYPPCGSHEWWPGRAVAAVADVPGHRPLLLVSVYLITGIGPTAGNLEVLAGIGQRIEALGGKHEFVLGGDINMEPPELAETGFENEVGAVSMCPATLRGTYRTSGGSSMLDYFMVSQRMAAAVDSVATEEGTGVKGHTPVTLKFKARATALRALHIRLPPRLGIERLYGPIPAAPDWTKAKASAVAALQAARSGSGSAQALLDDAYGHWADIAEQEVAEYTGDFPKKWGERGKMPKVVWRSVVPEASPARTTSHAAMAAWLGATVTEVCRIAVAVAIPGDIDVDADDVGDDPDDLLDGDAGALQTEDDIRRARARMPPTAPARCAAVLGEISESLIRDCPAGDDDDIGGRLGYIRGRVAECVQELRVTVDDACIGDDDRRSRIDAARAVLDPLRSELAEIEAASTAATSAEARQKWKEWIADGIDGGAAHAHAYTRMPRAWTPTTVTRPDGEPSSAVDDLMQEQRDKHRRMWRPAARPFHYRWDDHEELPMITEDRIRAAAATFATRTSTTYDGFHPRVIGCLSSEALEVLSLIYAAVEASAMWPRQVSVVIAVLLPKPKGGYRSIGLAAAAYRLWAKIRREEADAWEQQHQRAYLAAGKGGGTVDVVWRLAAQHEAGFADGDVAATVTEDVQSFFEVIDRDILLREAKALGFPLPIIKAALAAYSSARLMSMSGRVCRELYPTVGVLAGCSLAMVFTRIYTIRALDGFTAEVPKAVKLDTYVDDFTLSAVGRPEAVAADLLHAHGLLRALVEDTLKCSFAAGKTAVTATTRLLAARIARGVGLQGGVSSASALLGIDGTAAAPRAVLRRGSSKAGRLRAALARRRRIGHVRSAVGDKARKVFVAGVQPAAAYGTQIWGLDDGETRRLRRLAAAALRPGGRCRSLGMTLLWHDLPTATAEHAPIVQLSRAVWDAVVLRERAMSKGASISDIRQWWESACRQAEPLAQELRQRMMEAQLEGRDVPLSVTRKLWGRIRGPIGAAILTAARIGWKVDGAFRFIDHNQAEVLLTNTPPPPSSASSPRMR